MLIPRVENFLIEEIGLFTLLSLPPFLCKDNLIDNLSFDCFQGRFQFKHSEFKHEHLSLAPEGMDAFTSRMMKTEDS